MRRLFIPVFAFLCAVVFVASPLLPSARAQQPADADAAAARDRQLLGLALSGESGRAALTEYLAGSGEPEAIARRASALLEILRVARPDLPARDVLRAVDFVSNLAVRAISSTPIIQLAIDSGFRPRNALMALDFGPPDGDVMEGFQRVLPGDSRLQGAKTGGLRRPADNPLFSDGITGLRKIRLELPDGRYRLVLLTQDLGDPKFATLPFGREIRVNSVPILVEGNRPALWAREAYLAGETGLARRSDRLNRDGAYLAGELGTEITAAAARQRAGAVIVEGAARSGVLELELRGFATMDSYLTGMLVEPADSLSDVVLSGPVRRRLVSDVKRFDLEKEILSVAARAAEGLVPAEEPEFDRREKATDN